MYKYLIAHITFLSLILILVKSENLPDSCFCSNFYENSNKCDDTVSQLCYTCGVCYNDVTKLESYSLIKPCDSDNIEIHTDSTCTSYAGLIKDTCMAVDDHSSISLTSGNCLDLFLINHVPVLNNDTIDFNSICLDKGGFCDSANEIINCNSNVGCEALCIQSTSFVKKCFGGPNDGISCSFSSDCSTSCICDPLGICSSGGTGGISTCFNTNPCKNHDDCLGPCLCKPKCSDSGTCPGVFQLACVDDITCTGFCAQPAFNGAPRFCTGGPNAGTQCTTQDDCATLCDCNTPPLTPSSPPPVTPPPVTTPPSPPVTTPTPPSPSTLPPPTPSFPLPSASSERPTRPTRPSPPSTAPSSFLSCKILEESYIGNCECSGNEDNDELHSCDTCFLSVLDRWRMLDCDTLIVGDFGSDNSCNDLEFEYTDNTYPICTGGSFTCLQNLEIDSDLMKNLDTTPSTSGDIDQKSISYRLFCHEYEIIGGVDKPTNDVNLIKVSILNIIFYYIF